MVGNKKEKNGGGKTAPKSSWRVRHENGDEFGPADMATLIEWARDGRLAPTHMVSGNGKDWQPAGAIPELEMDWIGEIAPGTFYGPIHREALLDLIQEQSIPPGAAIFFRHAGEAGIDPARAEDDLRQRLKRTEEEFNKRLEENRAEISRHKREKETLAADLRAKDLEFEAERGELKAEIARNKAEILKRDSLLEALRREVADLEKACQGHQAAEMKRSEMEKTLADLKTRHARESRQLHEEQERKDRKLRQALEKTEKESRRIESALKEAQKDSERIRLENRALNKRVLAVRKLLENALDSISSGDDDASASVSTGPDTASPANSAPGGERMSRLSLASIEAQAQHELRTLKNTAMTSNPLR